MNQEVFAALGEAMKRAEDVALVTIVATNGSTPQRVGAKMLVFADGRTVGTIAAAAENDAFWKARASLESRKPARVNANSTTTSRRKTACLRRADGSLHRADEPSPAVISRRPRRLTTSASSRTESGSS
jgi:xanthine/CO dehydrogenase XdhC/CoxF family maturation factor